MHLIGGTLQEKYVPLPISKRYRPMEALPAAELPSGPDWQYEPKWDGFRCLAFRDGKRIDLLSKSGKPLTRYFPELVSAFSTLIPRQFVLDGEIVIPLEGSLSFDNLRLSQTTRGPLCYTNSTTIQETAATWQESSKI
jgi:ATP-dependent DNA ligase